MLSERYASALIDNYRVVGSFREVAREMEGAQIDRDFLARFDAGPDAFFEPLEMHLPRSFAALRDAYRDKALLLSGLSPESMLAFAAFELKSDRLIIAQASLDWEREMPQWEEARSWLPAPLRCFHVHFKGLHTSREPGNEGPTVESSNLPGGIFQWNSLELHRSSNRLRPKTFEKIARELGELDRLRIWIQSEWGDTILVREDAQHPALYHVAGGDFDGYEELKQPVETIDGYCAHVFSGVERPFDFRA